MHFASPIPWWLTVAAAAAIAWLAYFLLPPASAAAVAARRWTLTALRALAMAALVFFLCRPIVMRPPEGHSGVVVPILVDVSRSMRVPDVDGRPRIDRAVAALDRDLLPALGDGFTPELLRFRRIDGAGALACRCDRNARQSDLTGALAAVRERYRGQRSPPSS